jgi:hypothetical protein
MYFMICAGNLTMPRYVAITTPLLPRPRPKYCSQHPILRHPQSALLLQCDRPSFTPIQKRQLWLGLNITEHSAEPEGEGKYYMDITNGT